MRNLTIFERKIDVLYNGFEMLGLVSDFRNNPLETNECTKKQNQVADSGNIPLPQFGGTQFESPLETAYPASDFYGGFLLLLLLLFILTATGFLPYDTTNNTHHTK
jgi:hypothetical protein